MKVPYLEGTVHQRLIQVYDHADLPLVLVFDGRQEAEFLLLSGQDRHTHTHTSALVHLLCGCYSSPALTFIYVLHNSNS